MSGAPTIYHTSAESYLRQLAKAHQIEADYIAYARQIGCTFVMHDEIVANAEQAELLDAKWTELTK